MGRALSRGGWRRRRRVCRAAVPGRAAAAAAAAGGGGVVCVEPPSRAILRRRRPESASRRTRRQMDRLGAGSRRLTRVGPGRSTDLAGRARTGLPARAGLGRIGRAGRAREAAAPESRRRKPGWQTIKTKYTTKTTSTGSCRAGQYWPGLRGPGRRGARKPAAAASGMMKTPQNREAASQSRDYGDGGAQVKNRVRSKTAPRNH